MRALLALLLLAAPALAGADEDAAAALALARATRARVEPAPVVPTAPAATPAPPSPQPLVIATHEHRCPRCGNVWAHGDDSFGVAAAHVCPHCGFGPVWAVYRRYAAPRLAPVVQPAAGNPVRGVYSPPLAPHPTPPPVSFRPRAASAACPT
jgi:hypothetical protein